MSEKVRRHIRTASVEPLIDGVPLHVADMALRTMATKDRSVSHAFVRPVV